jgi:hypothetical protein
MLQPKSCIGPKSKIWDETALEPIIHASHKREEIRPEGIG